MIKEIHYRSWDQFKTQFWEHLPTESRRGKGDFVFRGHSNSAWPLEPSFTRAFRDAPSKALQSFQALLLKNFGEDVNLSGKTFTSGKPFLKRKPRERWAFGQHYGLPTPLLDWSESPYIATFMACEDAFNTIVKERMASNRRELNALSDRLSLFALRKNVHPYTADWKRMKVEFVDFRDIDNPRVRTQLGLFTVLPTNHKTLDDCIESYCRGRAGRKLSVSDFLLKFTLPYSAVFDALVDLELMDITPRRLYEGLEGICKSAKLRTQISTFS